MIDSKYIMLIFNEHLVKHYKQATKIFSEYNYTNFKGTWE